MLKKAHSIATMGGIRDAGHAFAQLPSAQRAQIAVLGRMGTPTLGSLGLGTANQLAHMESAATQATIENKLKRITPDMRLTNQ